MKFTPAVENFTHVTLTTVEQAKLRMTETLRDDIEGAFVPLAKAVHVSENEVATHYQHTVAGTRWLVQEFKHQAPASAMPTAPGSAPSHDVVTAGALEHPAAVTAEAPAAVEPETKQ